MALTTVCEADEYMYTKIGNQKWFDLSEIDKNAYLEEATRYIKSVPLINIPDEIPTDLKMACSEVAFNMVEVGTDAHTENIKKGIASISFGNDRVSYRADAKAENMYFTNYAYSLLDKYIQKGARIV